MGDCEKCLKKYPIEVDFFKFLELPKTSTDTIEPVLDKIDCINCKSNLCVNLINIFN